mmetsp:Transcript_56475/g.157408  ORF Transcript_56475/g.157408 Transcript_56475/m.157408 type:complete len:210 (+) Transcript_56475:118-747(+)
MYPAPADPSRPRRRALILPGRSEATPAADVTTPWPSSPPHRSVAAHQAAACRTWITSPSKASLGVARGGSERGREECSQEIEAIHLLAVRLWFATVPRTIANGLSRPKKRRRLSWPGHQRASRSYSARQSPLPSCHPTPAHLLLAAKGPELFWRGRCPKAQGPTSNTSGARRFRGRRHPECHVRAAAWQTPEQRTQEPRQKSQDQDATP